ncbi:MAG: hypothetical protein K9N11_10400 [Lentisphaeria bacterium]|nr:hypothetical protein [Candidatus Neomarinimicrobiota bacterium]MCF7843242.1 hypothetical protein [Lentisphaeria bacterium]
MKTKITIITVLSFLLIGCTEKLSDDKFLSGPPENYEALMTEGWNSFEAGRYTEAVEAFSMAAEREATLPEVYLGLGWSSLRAQALENGRSYFSSALAFAFLDAVNGPTIIIESKAGLAGIALAAGEYESAVGYVDEVLASDATFVFSHDSGVDVAALKKIKATAAYYMGDFSTAYQQVLDIGESLSVVNPVQSNGFSNAVAQATGSTAFNGIATVRVNAAHQLVLVSSAATTNATYEIKSTTEGSNTFTVFGNPALSTGDSLMVDYYYTDDFGKFLSDLVAIIE